MLFQPRSVAIVGAGSALGLLALRNLREAGFKGGVIALDTPADIAGLAEAPELGVIATPPEDVLPAIQAFGTLGTRAAISLSQGMEAPWPETECRVLGPASFGVIVPGLGLNVSSGHMQPRPGRLALVSQSAALCRAVIDWAEPNGVGFSHIVGIGGNRGIGFGSVLDWLARDPGTGAILLDIRSIRRRRQFLSAARAAARLRPVVAIHSGGRQHDPTGREDLVLGAALHRAGILRVTGMAELLAAAETLTRARAPRTEALMIATNAVGPGQMAADEAVRRGIPLAAPDVSARTVMQMHLPPQPADPGLVWTGDEHPAQVAETAAMLSALPEVGGVVAILSPTGPADAAGVAALAAGHKALRVPVLACVLGETTGAGHRRTLADAGVPVFASPEQAVRGFAQLVQLRRARAAAAELPPQRVLELAPDTATARAALAQARTAGRLVLDPAETGTVLAAYGITLDPALSGGPGRRLRVAVTDDRLFGPAIALGPAGQDTQDGVVIELPPLNLALAGSLAAQCPGAHADTAEVLVQVSQLLVDLPEIASLRLDPLLGRVAAGAEIRLRPAGEQGVLAIAPYPADLAEHWESDGHALTIRPIRPEDAAAHTAFFARLSPEDVRYRFFSMLRQLPPEQIARMTHVATARQKAFVDGLRDRTVGVARLVREPPGLGGEFAIVVAGELKGHGVGRRLMRKLMDWGRSQGMSGMTGQVLADNTPMLAFMRRLGFSIRRIPDEADVVEAGIAF